MLAADSGQTGLPPEVCPTAQKGLPSFGEPVIVFFRASGPGFGPDPAVCARLPRIHNDESRTQGLDRLELIRFLQVAQTLTVHDGALAFLLGINALRASEAAVVRIEDYQATLHGHRVLHLVGKGSKPATMPLTVSAIRVLEACRGQPTQGPLVPVFVQAADGQWQIHGQRVPPGQRRVDDPAPSRFRVPMPSPSALGSGPRNRVIAGGEDLVLEQRQEPVAVKEGLTEQRSAAARRGASAWGIEQTRARVRCPRRSRWGGRPVHTADVFDPASA